MHVAIRVTAGPTPERQRTVLVTADEYVIGTVLDALRFRLGFRLPDDFGEEPLPPAHQPRRTADVPGTEMAPDVR